MPWGVVAGAVIGAVGQNQAAKGAAKGADAQAAASQAAVAEQQRQFDLTRQDQMPWLQAGQWGLGQQQKLLQGDMSSFYDSPDYKYALEQMQKGIERGAGARGSLYSGGTNVDLANALGGLASQNYSNFYSRLGGLAGGGQQSAQSLGSFGANAANQIGSAYQNAGDARASAYGQIGQGWQQYANNTAGLINYGQQNNWGRK